MFGLTGVLPYVLGIVLALGAFGGTYLKGRWDGAASRNPEIVSYQVAIKDHERIALEAQARASKASASVVTKWRERTVTIVKEAEAAERIVEVVKNESDPNCKLPPSWRVLWDAPDASSGAASKHPNRTDGPPVEVADAARAVSEAREAFELNRAKLEALQDYLSKIQEAGNG